jgi:hypothetical protein
MSALQNLDASSQSINVRDESDVTVKARDLTDHVVGETWERERGFMLEGSKAADEAIASRANQHLDAYLEAKRPALEALGDDTRGRGAEINRRDVEVVSVETAHRWARLDAADFRGIDDASLREDAARVIAGNASARYHHALREVAPDVADAVQAYEGTVRVKSLSMGYPAFEEDRPLEQTSGALPAEAGKTYRGRVVAINDMYLVQDVGSDQRLVRHSRYELHGSALASLAPGTKVDIRYPASRIGIVSEWGAKHVEGRASKGLAPKGLGD